jgi:hypothetical protein
MNVLRFKRQFIVVVLRQFRGWVWDASVERRQTEVSKDLLGSIWLICERSLEGHKPFSILHAQ